MSIFWATLREETFPSPFLQLLKGMEVSQKWTGVADHTGIAGAVLVFPLPLPPFGQSLISIISDVPMLRHQIRHMAHRESARTSGGGEATSGTCGSDELLTNESNRTGTKRLPSV